MTDSMKLRNIVESSGLKKTFIAKELGLSYQGYLNKESGRRQFNANEIKALKNLLQLTNKEISDIFLS